MSEKNYKLTKKDRLTVFWRSQFLQASWNFERMQNVGWAYAMIPALKKLYTTKEDRAQALKRHLEFFNTHPYLAAPVLGVTLTLEEERAAGRDIDNAAIQGVKIGMMGPLAGVGDPIFWGTLRPIIGAFAASLALSGSTMGPLLFFVLWNVIRLIFTWYTQELGYRSGNEITKDLEGGILQKLTTGASILGMFVMGVLVPRWTSMNFPLVISELENDAKNIVDFQGLAEMANDNTVTVDKLRDITNSIMSGNPVNEMNVQTLGDVFNELLPGMMPLILTFVVLWLMRKKDVNPITLILAIFVLGIIMYSLGVMV